MNSSFKTTDPFSFTNFFVSELNRINSINNIPKHSGLREAILTIIESRVSDRIINRDECLMRQDKLDFEEYHFKNSKDQFNQLNVAAVRYYFVSGLKFEKDKDIIRNPFIQFSDFSPTDSTVIILEDELNKLVQHLAVAYDEKGNPLKIKYKELPYINMLTEYWRITEGVFPILDLYRDTKNMIFMEVLIKHAALFRYIEYAYDGIIDLDKIIVPILLTMESVYVSLFDQVSPRIEGMTDDEFQKKLKSEEEIPFDKESGFFIYRHCMEQNDTKIQDKTVKHVYNMAKSIKDIIAFANESNDSWHNNIPGIVKIASIVKNFENEWMNNSEQEIEA